MLKSFGIPPWEVKSQGWSHPTHSSHNRASFLVHSPLLSWYPPPSPARPIYCPTSNTVLRPNSSRRGAEGRSLSSGRYPLKHYLRGTRGNLKGTYSWSQKHMRQAGTLCIFEHCTLPQGLHSPTLSRESLLLALRLLFGGRAITVSIRTSRRFSVLHSFHRIEGTKSKTQEQRVERIESTGQGIWAICSLREDCST
jgi:hypothetical protein